MAKELDGELRAARSTRAEEEHELQPSGEDQPEADRVPEPAPEDRELRSELARHLERGIYPADRDAVVATLRRHHAPDRLVELARRLPAGRYENVQALVDALVSGGGDRRADG
nr:DUF2795 domain-containing protein [Streptomyces boncukensis]